MQIFHNDMLPHVFLTVQKLHVGGVKSITGAVFTLQKLANTATQASTDCLVDGLHPQLASQLTPVLVQSLI